MTGKGTPKVPNSPFAPIVPLFIETVDSDLFFFLEEVHNLIQQFPALLDAVEKDLLCRAGCLVPARLFRRRLQVR